MAFLIIGAGHAGASVAIELRKAGYAEPIAIIGDERVIPYQRPPLSKAWLKGEADNDSLALRSASWYASNEVDLRLGVRVLSIDRAQRRVALSDGPPMTYDHLVLATGARARALAIPGAELDGMLSLRTTVDADELKSRIKVGARVVLIGGGYVGLETAASARALGAEVTVIEREPRVLARVASTPLSDFFTQLHRSKGVAFELSAGIRSFVGHSGQINAVELGNGHRIDCDVAIVGVGAVPNAELASACGLRCDDGVIVDETARTSDPLIFAIGDVSVRPVPRYSHRLRLESVPNALEQAKQVAAAVCEKIHPAPEVPWFWSDQYDVKLQIAGLSLHGDRMIVRGNPEDGKFSVVHLRGNQIEALEAVNAPADFVFAKALIARAAQLNPEKVTDSTVSLRDTLA